MARTPRLAPVANASVPCTLQSSAILLHGGCALVFFAGAQTPPPQGAKLHVAGGISPSTAACWPTPQDAGRGWCGLALLPALPGADVHLSDPGSGGHWQFDVGNRIDVAAQSLFRLTEQAGVNSHNVFTFLVDTLLQTPAANPATAQGHLQFVLDFLSAAAERDGFVEILATPEGGGLFAQGWSQSICAGALVLPGVACGLRMRAVDLALFDRDDILAPACGFCFYDKTWQGPAPMPDQPVFFERDGRLLRLDVVAGPWLHVDGQAATTHVAQMLPRLRAPVETMVSFRRICRPRFSGEDTLSGTTVPVAVGLDAVLRAPDGTILVVGWMLDPARRVKMALIKSLQRRYAAISTTWIPLPRPDLNTAFAADPRLAGLLDPQEVMHGFVAHAAAPAHGAEDGAEDADVYLELVLDDESCLFQPMRVVAFAGTERLAQVLATIAPDEPMLGRIIEDHLAPFLASVRPASASLSRGVAPRPIMLGRTRSDDPLPDCPAPGREVDALMPLRSMAELQPVFGLLAGTPDAACLWLTLIATRATAAELLQPLEAAFRFYGLCGSLVIAPDHGNTTAWLDVGLAATHSAQVLCWQPSALPKTAGWLQMLLTEAGGLPSAGLVSPAMTYEDGSIHFGGAAGRSAAVAQIGPVVGYGPEWLHRGSPTRLAAGTAEIALIGRDLLTRCGGFSGHLFSDAFAHFDLAARLKLAGAETWCSGAVEFWMLDTPSGREDTPLARILRKVDASLIARRGGPSLESLLS